MSTVSSLWLQRGNRTMEKLNLRPSKPARIVIQKNGDWYVLWYSNSQRYRQKFGLNYIKDLALRQRWAERLVHYINQQIELGYNVSDVDVPSFIIPPPLVPNPVIENIITQEKKDITFFQYWRKFIEMKEMEGSDRGWIKKFESVLNLLKKFAESEGVEDYSFFEIDREWALRFKKYTIGPPLEHGINHLAKNFRLIRQVLRDAEIEADLPVNQKYKSKAFKVNEVKTDEIALSLDEVVKFWQLDLTNYPPGYTIVRDNFVLGCLTGLRYSDWVIKPENLKYIKNEERTHPILKVITRKTKEDVYIPLHPIVLAILQQHKFDIPSLTNQKSNLYLKEIAKLVGLDEKITLRRSTAGKMVLISRIKHEEVKTHTARRTFVTIGLFEMKLPPQLIMKITGHKTEKQLFEYARVGKEQAAIIMVEAMDIYLKKNNI